MHSGFGGIQGFILSRILKGGWGKMLPALLSRVLAAIGDGGQFEPGAVPMKDRTYTRRLDPEELREQPRPGLSVAARYPSPALAILL